MPRHKKDAHPISLKMDQATYDRPDAFCDRAGQPKTIAIERAVNLYIYRYYEIVRQHWTASKAKNGVICADSVIVRERKTNGTENR